LIWMQKVSTVIFDKKRGPQNAQLDLCTSNLITLCMNHMEPDISSIMNLVFQILWLLIYQDVTEVIGNITVALYWSSSSPGEKVQILNLPTSFGMKNFNNIRSRKKREGTCAISMSGMNVLMLEMITKHK